MDPPFFAMDPQLLQGRPQQQFLVPMMNPFYPAFMQGQQNALDDRHGGFGKERLRKYVCFLYVVLLKCVFWILGWDSVI